ncbi:MAG: hypothetical protein AAFO07_13075 [Bacteroidota bacterium]
MTRVSLICLLFVALISFSCQEKKDENLESFLEFYDQFHQDTAFQMAHIDFPLEGLPSGADSLFASNEKFYWQKEDWEFHQKIEFEYSEFTQNLQFFSEDLLVEKIVHNTGSYGMMRRFAKYDGEWYLIYYAGPNRLKPKPQIFID